MTDKTTCNQNDSFMLLNVLDKPFASYTIAINTINKILKRTHAKLYSRAVNQQLRKHIIDEQCIGINRIMQQSFEGKDIGETVKYITTADRTIGVLEDFQISDEPVMALVEISTVRKCSDCDDWNEPRLQGS